MNPHSNANPNTRHSPNARNASASEPWIRNPTAKPIAVVIASDQGRTTVSASARQVIDTPPRAGGRRPHAGEQHAGGDEPGHQEVDVADAAGAVDRAAEHVAEDQQEH